MVPEEKLDTLADRLRWALEQGRSDLTQSELADRLDVSESAVSLWMNGKRECPKEQVRRIARITRVEPGWLLTGEGEPSGDGEEPGTSTEEETLERPPLRWGFRPSTRHGKDFGDPGVYATPQSVRTFVRENGQNSSDQVVDDHVVMRFRVIELEPSSDRYDRFLEALNWEELARHFEAVDASEYQSKLSAKVRTAYRRIQRREKLVLLAVDDFGTTGLRGKEFDSGAPFAALVRDTLNSQKEERTAGGAFGVGAKVNFACSALSTVVFASRVNEESGGKTRLIAKNRLPWHALEDDAGEKAEYAGPGWLGEMEDETEELTRSVRVPNDATILDDLMVRRTEADLPREMRVENASGTTLLVVGFRDPDVEGVPNTANLADKLAEEAARNFWPSMVRGRLTVWVERYLNDARDPSIRKAVNPEDYVPELCDAWAKYVGGDTSPVLEEPGDVASESLQLEIPATQSDAKGVEHHASTRSECQLLVRLSESEDGALENNLGYVRGRGMIVKYVRKRGLPLGARPFQAVLLAGTLVSDSQEQENAEQFLRFAEPPAHNDWEYNSDLGEKYERGAGARLDELEDRINETLRDLVQPPLPETKEGPAVLRNLLQLKTPTSDPTDRPKAKVLSADGVLIDGAWRVEAEVSVDQSPKELVITPWLGFEREDGPSVPVRWKELESDDAGIHLEDGRFVVKPRTRRFRFKGTSDPESHPANPSKCAALLNVRVKERKSDG